MNGTRLPILIVDDDQLVINSTTGSLIAEGLTNIIECLDSRRVDKILDQQPIGVILLDLMMPHVSGQEILENVSMNHPEIPVIIVTAVSEIDLAVQCMKLGAQDYLVKPVEKSRLISTIRRALEMREIQDEYSTFKEKVFNECLTHPEQFNGMVTKHPSMMTLFRYMETIAATPWPVLITGETGTGKDLAAQVLHRLSQRTGPFVVVNVAGLDETVFSDTLFGHLKGSYTGADTSRNGLVETAAQGTLFLDEIGDLAPASQIKLLRLLQDQTYFPLGADMPRKANVRVMVATNCNLDEAQNSGRFRKDLYYRLVTHHVHLPPLRERRGDVPLLLNHFLEKAARELGRKKPAYPQELGMLLCTYSFPGNIRELESMVCDAVTRHPGRMLSMESFKRRIQQTSTDVSPEKPVRDETLVCSFNERLPTLKECQAVLIAEAMKRSGNNQSLASTMLGITRTALNKRLRKAT
jgi:two-component system nitrogen regulation response regulator GlnG